MSPSGSLASISMRTVSPKVNNLSYISVITGARFAASPVILRLPVYSGSWRYCGHSMCASLYGASRPHTEICPSLVTVTISMSPSRSTSVKRGGLHTLSLLGSEVYSSPKTFGKPFAIVPSESKAYSAGKPLWPLTISAVPSPSTSPAEM